MPKSCPLLLISPTRASECSGEGCAWYVRFETPGIKTSSSPEGCAIERLAYLLNTIEYKMPLPK